MQYVECSNCGIENCHLEQDIFTYFQCLSCGAPNPCFPEQFEIYCESNGVDFHEELEKCVLSLDNMVW